MNFLIFLCSLFYLQNALANEKVRLAFTDTMPPYLSQSLDGGIEYEIIKAAFLEEEYELERPFNVHYKRAVVLLSENKAHAIVGNMNNSFYKERIPKAVTANQTLTYIDCAATLKRKNIEFKNIRELSNKRVNAFKLARRVLGKDFALMANENKDYNEGSKQELLPKLLLNQRIDVVVTDKNIFVNRIKNSIGQDKMKLFKYQQVAPPTPRSLIFTDKKLLERFNQGLQKIRDNGTYKKLMEGHTENYFTEC